MYNIMHVARHINYRCESGFLVHTSHLGGFRISKTHKISSQEHVFSGSGEFIFAK